MMLGLWISEHPFDDRIIRTSKTCYDGNEIASDARIIFMVVRGH